MLSEIRQLQKVKSSTVTPVRVELKEVETEKEARRTAAARQGWAGMPGKGKELVEGHQVSAIVRRKLQRFLS